MKKSAIDQIFEGMLFPRQPNYLSNPKYANNPRWLEQSKSIYLTSSKFKYMWWYKTWKDCVTGYYTDKRTKYNITASDFFDNIDNGLKTWGDYRRAKRTMNELDFRMEYLNEAIGESDDAFFTLKSFLDNQILKKGFTPPTPIQFYLGTDLGNPKKKQNEVRLVGVDYAFANTTSRLKTDNTIFMCVSLHWKRNRFERHVDYIEAYPAGETIKATHRLRELYWDYDADYIVPDIRSGGETLYNVCTEIWEHPQRGANWNPHGLTVVPNMKYQVATENKIKDLQERTVDPMAIECIIPYVGSSTQNSTAWAALKRQLDSNNIKFLIPMSSKQEMLEDSGEYYQMSSEQLAEVLNPYGQTDLLAQEAINLTAEIKLDRIKLTEPTTGTKDRIVILSYLSYIADLIENQWQKDMQSEEIDYSNVELVW